MERKIFDDTLNNPVVTLCNEKIESLHKICNEKQNRCKTIATKV